MFPVDAQITARIPLARAWVTATVIPRSLNDPVGFAPSTLRYTSQPVCEDNAGAVLSPDALSRAAAGGLAPKKLLADNDGYSFLEALGDLVVTGPTRTNVNDYRIILVR